MQLHCEVHGGTESIAACGSCGTRMCNDCFRFLVLRKPICVRCAHERKTRARRRVSVGVFVSLVCFAAGWLLWKKHGLDSTERLLLLGLTLAGAAIGSWLALRSSSNQGPLDEVTRRIPADAWTAGHASRREIRQARLRRVAASFIPTVSGRTTALVTLGTMIVTASVFPLLLHQPRWIEVELVLLVWWTLAVLALWMLLYRDYQVEDDHYFHAPSRLGADAIEGIGDAAPGCDFGIDGCESVAVPLGALVAIVFLSLVAILIAWLVVELVIPIVFLALYVTTLAAIRRASRDRHDCKDNIGRSLRWALTWATLYVAPIATLVWLLHQMLPVPR